MGEHHAVVAMCNTHTEAEAPLKSSTVRLSMSGSSRSSGRITTQTNMWWVITTPVIA